HGGGAKILAGGQSLLPLMNLRLVRPPVVIDINRISALAYIRETDGVLALGGLSRLHAVVGSDAVTRRAPLLAEAAAHVGHLAIRHRGTIGGNLAHADPASEIPAALLALEGEVVATGPRGARTIAVAGSACGRRSESWSAPASRRTHCGRRPARSSTRSPRATTPRRRPTTGVTSPAF